MLAKVIEANNSVDFQNELIVLLNELNGYTKPEVQYSTYLSSNGFPRYTALVTWKK